MPESARLQVILCWHMHQPEYRDLSNGEWQLPWTYLHGIKDYVDMAAHLEADPGARAVVNFAPVLLEQIADYVAGIEAWFEHGTALADPLLAALAASQAPAGAEARHALARQCLRANEQRIIARFAPYARLAEIARWHEEEPSRWLYLADQFLFDLLAWYHLGWIAESVRRSDARVQALQQKASGFTLQDRHVLLGIVLEQLRSVVPRYRDLAKAGRVELAMSPYAHPILPLLIDMQSAREAQPEAPLPGTTLYPGGLERARWHLRHGREVFERHFGVAAQGCWPSEGALSDATLGLLAEEGFRWSASGERVLLNSTHSTPASEHVGEGKCRHRVYRAGAHGIDCFFRDDGLSDLIGFEYSDWHAEDAVANLVHHMENIAAACPDCSNCAITVILDGENAWEYYPENAWHFLRALYRALGTHPRLEPATFSSFLENRRPAPVELPALVAGSWVHGTLSTWIGSADKNRGWEMLVDAKRCFDRVLATGTLDPERARRAGLQLAICEGSDWFWWFGDYNPAQSVSDFDRLYRMHLSNLYALLGVQAPAYLAHSFSRGSSSAAPATGGVMRAGSETPA